MYKLKKKAKNWKESVIEKPDVVTFTIEQADQNQKEYKRLETEWTAQLRVCIATMENLKRHHPKATALPETEKVAAKMYLENDLMAKEIRPKLKRLKEVIKEYEGERRAILKEFNWQDEGAKG
jgi:hypothetical protein